MPELPEVETYVRELEPLLVGRRVTAVCVKWSRTIATPAAAEFEQALAGSTFSDFDRRGKFMLFGLDDGRFLVVHLRMTGKLQVVPQTTIPDKHVHVVIDLDNDTSLHFQDTRKFGRMWLTDDVDLVLTKLGPEPLGAAFTPDYLAEKLASRKASIKALLLDQGIVAGVGNIYADEALFRARIHPARVGGSLSPDEIDRMYAAIVALLTRAIELQGSSLGTSSLQNYSRPGGQPGGFQEEHWVFRRTGEPCVNCGHPIERSVIAQRSTHFCPVCQPADPD
jgi:formamidopyrimidine-DNA glycosylase